jgi:hypothetical protein
MRALARHGPCPEHRASFANVNGLVRDLPVVDEEPMLGAEGDEQEGAGPEVAGQAVAQAGNGPVDDGQVRSRELLGEELAYR